MEVNIKRTNPDLHYIDHTKINCLKNLPIDELNNEAFVDLINDDDINEINIYLNRQKINFMDGDIIAFSDENRYRNSGLCVWFNGSIHHLEHDVDEYGALPKFIEVTTEKFDKTTWLDLISHNDYYWVCDQYREEAYDNVKIEYHVLYENKIEDIFITYYTHNGKKEYLILNPDDVDDNTTIDDFKSIIMNKNIPWQHDTSDYDDKLNKVGRLSMVSNFEINNDDNSDY
jgi:hypothetical protein